MMEELIDVLLLAALLLVALQVIGSRGLVAAIMTFGAFSLVCAGLFVTLDAVDVAFTEAAVGAGVATLLMLAALQRCGGESEAAPRVHWGALVVVLGVGGLLVWGTLDLPPVGEADNPAHQHVAPRYLEQSGVEIGIPNVVTSVLASYRGFDTLGEVVVIFTAGLGVWLLLSSRRREEGE
ncbi:MAG: DUF4040 domain-containing protein [Steroidobacteraceae bacterium]|jgi:multicomponent Na+:H+ antiporter subunit B